MSRRVSIVGLAAGVGATGLLLLGQGLWIPAKAAVAQVLLRQAWADARGGEVRARPWPWADTWPVARLEAPEHGVDLVVLAGANGGSLAFAPGHVEGTVAPGSTGTAVIAGHRDTHFEFIRRVRLGDRLRIETPDGASLDFEVVDLAIVDTREPLVVEGTLGELDPGSSAASRSRRGLALVTCYPFDTPVPGGPLRYVVTATTVAETQAGSIGTSLLH